MLVSKRPCYGVYILGRGTSKQLKTPQVQVETTTSLARLWLQTRYTSSNWRGVIFPNGLSLESGNVGGLRTFKLPRASRRDLKFPPCPQFPAPEKGEYQQVGCFELLLVI